jgi:3-oxoacyl-(acyl-carrier-protein) synthase/cyclopropane fatty-acyl-phospholipid synthase-like methyltransferase/NAD(P)-dependent dehydrogenase (short-subunit alcohol dehydrogenase family)
VEIDLSSVHEALRLVEKLERKLAESEEQRFAPIAIIGMACRVPGADSPDELWDLVTSGKSAFRDAATRWPEVHQWYSADPSAQGRSYIRNVALLDSVDEFDAAFFGISPREAERMDPQHRLLLELAWHALERAGIPPHSLSGSPTGVYAGVYNTNYSRFGLDSPHAETIDSHSLSGGAPCIATGRLSYLLGLQGPSITIDTACSSSLVAVQLAMESLRRGECSLALAGGVHLLLSPLPLVALSKSRMVSETGSARAFDASADGFVPGEGGGLVVLKRLSDARHDGDPIIAVINGGAVNQDGRSAGLTAPNGQAQEALFAASLRNAGVRPEEIGYLEAHGTSTRLGDPIELNAAAAALCKNRSIPLRVGAIKNNLGHLEAAAGILGLIKTALVLQRGTIPPCAGFSRLNPEIDFAGGQFMIPERAEPWPVDQPKVAAVSAFGFSGTNANLVLSAAPEPAETSTRPEGPSVLMVSARTPNALQVLATKYIDLLSRPAAHWMAICDAARSARSHFEHRIAVVANGCCEAAEALKAWLHGGTPSALVTGYVPQDPALSPLPECVGDMNKELLSIAHAYCTGGQPERGEKTESETAAVLPTYPFQRRRYWFDPCASLPVNDPPEQAFHTNGISHYFDAISTAADHEGQIESEELRHHVTFGVFPDKVSSFSFVQAFFEPELYPEQYSVLLEGQRRLKSILFSQVDLSQIRRVLDYGCGLGSDLIELAKDHTSMSLDGFTISAEQARLGNRRAASLGLSRRVQIFHRDSAVHPFPGNYDLIIGFEVTGLIADKESLFDNIRNHLPPGGHLLIADCIAPFTTFNNETSTYTLTANDWNKLLAKRGIRVAELVDVSQEVANCIEDPLYQERLTVVGEKYGFDGTTMRHLSSHGRVGPALRRGHLQYVLLHAICESAPSPRLLSQNERWFKKPLSYAELDLNCERKQTAPLYEPQWRRTTAPAARRSSRMAQAEAEKDLWEQATREGYSEYERAQKLLESLATDYFIEALRRLDWDFQAGVEISIDECLGCFHVLPKFERFLRRIFQILEEDGILQTVANDVFSVLRELPDTQINKLSRALDEHGKAGPEARLLNRCGSNLAQALTGSLDPIELIFSGGSLSDAEALYRDSVPTRILNTAVARILRREFEAREQPIRVLEVGAGTGSTTEAILSSLPEGSRYCFSDVSRHFLRGAQKKFGSSLEYKLFDLEKRADEQDFSGRQFDLIIAANVIHATSNLRDTLARLSELLAPGGRLAVVEAVGALRWVDVIFGLTDGWWSFADTDLRSDYALLPIERWKQLFSEAGLSVKIAVPAAAISGKVVMLAQKPARWIILPDRKGIAEAVTRRLTADSSIVAEISQHECLAEDADTILDLRALDLDVHEDPLTALVPLVQTGAELSGMRRPPELAVFTRGACSAGGRDAITPAQATVWGLGRVLKNEQPDLRLRLVDLDPAATVDETVTAVFSSLHGDAREIAWSDGEPYAFKLKDATLPAGSVSFRPDAAYVITGGYGGLGLSLAEWMTSRGARHIWLLGRSGPRPDAAAAMERVRATGATVYCEQVDIADAIQVESFLKRVAETGLRLRGIFHAAGVLLDQSVARLDHETLSRVLDPKVRGVWLLHSASENLNLDWFVLFSSAAPLVGTPGQGAHAAANAWMDALAHYRRARGLSGISINWGAWAETGSAAHPDRLSSLARRGVEGMTTREALEALESVMAANATQMAVLRIDWKRFSESIGRELNVIERQQPMAEAPPPLATHWKSSLEQELREALPRERQELAIAHLEPIAHSILGLPPAERIHPRQPLRAIGLDSLLSLELRDQIGRRIGRGLPATLLFEQPTLESLAGYVLDELGLATVTGSDALHQLSADELGALLDRELLENGSGRAV